MSNAIFVFCLISKMLLHRSRIVFEVCLVILIAHGTISTDYDYGTSEDDEYTSGYTDGHKHPDYTKFFDGQVAASGVIANKQSPDVFGFVNPNNFESFFNTPLTAFGEPKPKASTAPKTFLPPPNKKLDPFEALRKSFGPNEAASENNPLKEDYFEESQKNQQAEESEIRPGPHYVSHQIPVSDIYDNEERAQSKEDIEAIPPGQKSKNKKKKKKVKSSSAPPGYENFKGYEGFESLGKEEEEQEQTKVDPLTYYGGKNVDYNTGKSSSTVSQYPSASGYISNIKIPTTTLKPYQKFGFKPVATNYEALQSKYLESLDSTDSPLKNVERAALNTKSKIDGATAATHAVPENLKNKNCRRIEGPENAADMNCFVCEDAPNKAKYTQCSYTSKEQPVNQYAGSSIRYSAVKAPASLRNKRSPRGSRYSDPYYQVAEKSRQYFEDIEKEQEAEESERQKEWNYTPYDPSDYESYSESQSSELLKQPGACKKVEREGSTCTVCKDPKTGGNFEQCSYTTAPKEQKYAYVAEKKYDSDEDEPEETKVVTKESSSDDPEKGSSSEPIPQSAVAPPSKFSTATKSKILADSTPDLAVAATTIDEASIEVESDEDDESDAEEESDDSESKKKEKKADGNASPYFDYSELKKDKKLVEDDPYDVPEHFAASITKEKAAGDEEDFDEYHYKLFPELNKQKGESRYDEQTGASETKQQDVEEVLAEFAKKDRSNCKKAQKNGMTCFLCVDQNKIQHEECMYIAESKPWPSHVAYHEVQRLKDPKGEYNPLAHQEVDNEESKKIENRVQQPVSLSDVLPLASETSKRKKFFKKVITTPLPLANLELSAAASNVQKTVVPYEKQSKRFSKTTVTDSKAAGSAPDSERLEDDSKKDPDDPEAPKEIEINDEEGAYSHETKPVYSKLYGTTLPKYMVEKTDFEKDFDAASGFA